MAGVIDPIERRQAQRWMAAMMKCWEPLGRLPHTEAEMCALGLENGLEGDWEAGDRLDLIWAATRRPTPLRAAFVTLACRDWPQDLVRRGNVWLLPLQLAWSFSDIELLESNGGLPEGMTRDALPQRREGRRRAHFHSRSTTRGAAPEGTAPVQPTHGRGGGGATRTIANVTA